MQRTLASILGTVFLVGALAIARQSGSVSEDSDQHIKIEFKGPLHRGAVRAGGVTTPPTVDAKGLPWELDFSGRPDLLRLAGELDNRTVLVSGSFEYRKHASGKGRWVCVVTDLKAATDQPKTKHEGKSILKGTFEQIKKAQEMLVAYQPGQADAAVAVCRQAGLEVIENHKPGSFLRCRWPKGLSPEILDRLVASPAIRYVEPNYEVKLDPIENPGLPQNLWVDSGPSG